MGLQGGMRSGLGGVFKGFGGDELQGPLIAMGGQGGSSVGDGSSSLNPGLNGELHKVIREKCTGVLGWVFRALEYSNLDKTKRYGILRWWWEGRGAIVTTCILITKAVFIVVFGWVIRGGIELVYVEVRHKASIHPFLSFPFVSFLFV